MKRDIDDLQSNNDKMKNTINSRNKTIKNKKKKLKE